jgi:hypothetical protein
MFGDSHTRGCAAEVKQQLTNDFEVFVFVIPGPGTKFVKDTARAKVQQLRKKDVVLWWALMILLEITL